MSLILELKKIKRNFLRRRKFKSLTNALGSDILKSKDFRMNNIKECFKNRRIATPDTNIIDRVMASYNKAKSNQKSFSSAYQVGNEWLPIYERHMGDVIKALGSSDAAATKTIYENFMREDCSVGLHGLPIDMKEAYFSGNISNLNSDIHLHDSIYRYSHWLNLTENKYSLKDLQMPDYGNPYGYFVNNEFIRVGAEYLHYYASRIQELIQEEKGRKVVVELGGGYGGLGYFLTRMESDLCYIDFDLPENMALTAYYLLSSFPGKKILLYGEDEFNEQSSSNYDIIIMPNFELPKLASNIADLVFNSYSLAEMSTDTISTYIPTLKEACKKHFFHVNHTQISYSLKADDFGIEDNEFSLITKKPALWNMGRDVNMDEFEFLYTRTR
ncbi:putative sugar O-methyltransferase [Pedobacter duraquae]|nr:putative sugar O-methyltransferase [Pedobacter duraquae]